MNTMRKYRGKRIDTGEWVVGDLLHVIIRGRLRVFIIPEGRVCEKHTMIKDLQEEVDPKSVGQETGKDNTYAGDVIEDQNGMIWFIEYSEINAAFIAVDTWKFHQSKPLHYLEIVKVLGNIHDNPDLIKR